MATPHGRLMVMAPPGSAKSTYATVVAPSWYLGTTPDRRVILASYGGDLARRHDGSGGSHGQPSRRQRGHAACGQPPIGSRCPQAQKPGSALMRGLV
jgi:hypothetical protein